MSKRTIAASLLTLLVIMGVGCSGDTTGPETRDEIVVFGFLYVGETVSDTNAIRISRTRPVLDHYDPDEAAVRDARVVLREEGRTDGDTLVMVRPGYYANPAIVIDSLTTYHLRIEIPGEEPITASTTTPNIFETGLEPLQVPETMRHETIPDEHPITLTCPDEEQIIYLDVYCTEDWEDARYINVFGGNDRPEDYDEFGGDEGEPRHIIAYFRLNDIEEEDDHYLLDWYNAMMVFYGSYDVQLFSIDDNYYNYLFREHPELSGGVEGGIGVFGSAFRERYQVEVTE